MVYCPLDPKENISMKFYLKLKNSVQENNAFENAVCEMAAILSRPNVFVALFFWVRFASILEQTCGFG